MAKFRQGRRMQVGCEKIAIFNLYLAICRKWRKIGPYEVVRDLSNGAIFIDLEWPLTQISKARQYLTLTISETVQNRYIVTMEY